MLGQVSYRNFRRLQGAGGTKSSWGAPSVQNRARYADLPHQPGFAGLRTHYYNTVLEGVLATCGGNSRRDTCRFLIKSVRGRQAPRRFGRRGGEDGAARFRCVGRLARGLANRWHANEETQ